MLMGQPRQGPRIGLGAGGGLGMHEGQHLGVGMGLERLLHLVRIHRAAPGILHHHRGGATALDVFLHTSTEHAVLTDDGLVARLQQVDEAHLHAGGAGGGDRHGEGIVGLEGITQQVLHLLHHGHEHGIEVTDGGPCHGLQDAWVHIGRTGAHQGTDGRMEGLVAHGVPRCCI